MTDDDKKDAEIISEFWTPEKMKAFEESSKAFLSSDYVRAMGAIAEGSPIPDDIQEKMDSEVERDAERQWEADRQEWAENGGAVEDGASNEEPLQAVMIVGVSTPSEELSNLNDEQAYNRAAWEEKKRNERAAKVDLHHQARATITNDQFVVMIQADIAKNGLGEVVSIHVKDTQLRAIESMPEERRKEYASGGNALAVVMEIVGQMLRNYKAKALVMKDDTEGTSIILPPEGK